MPAIMASPRSWIDIFFFLPFRRLVMRLIEQLQFARLECVRCNDHLFPWSAELLEISVRDIPELHIDDARIGPLSAWSVVNAADNGFHLVCADIGRQQLIVQA